MAKRYPEEMKQVMVGKYEGGSTAKTICAEYGVSRSTLLLWAKQVTKVCFAAVYKAYNFGPYVYPEQSQQQICRFSQKQ